MKSQLNLMLLSFIETLCFGCGTSQTMPTDAIAGALTSDNGLSVNGLSANGLSANGLSANGLSVNGLSVNGLSTQGITAQALNSLQFQSWFLGQEAGTAYTNMVMRYLVKCALPASASLSVTIADTTYVWLGELDLAPEWAKGNPIPTLEQQLITACLAAHVNKYGLNLGFSVLGYKSNGTAIPIGQTELTDYAVKEGCFFGNLFSGEGVFVGGEQAFSATYSSARACAISDLMGHDSSCPPMIFAGACKNLCVADSSTNAYLNCTYNSKTYAAINTRVAASQIYQCGDGICQISESCGTASIRDNCRDCGPCL